MCSSRSGWRENRYVDDLSFVVFVTGSRLSLLNW